MMEKALEKIKEIIDFCDAVCCHRAIFESIKFVEKELEEAMKPKTCDGCKYLDGVICKHDRGLYCIRQFEADYFKSKDNA